MSFVPVAPGKNQSYVPPKQQTLSGRTEQGRAGQLSGLYLFNKDIPESKWMAEKGQRDRYHPERFYKTENNLVTERQTFGVIM